jgi:hypothetical protein
MSTPKINVSKQINISFICIAAHIIEHLLCDHCV